MTAANSNGGRERLRRMLDEVVRSGGLSDAEPSDELPLSSVARKRAWRNARGASRLARATLVRDESVLRWVYEPPPLSTAGRRMRRTGGSFRPSDEVYGFSFNELPPNLWVKKIQELDARLTPDQGLRQLGENSLQSARDVPTKGRILLLVHGTFSKSDMFVSELSRTAAGKQFLSVCRERYKRILAFDHPTLSVSPWLNALDLHRALPSTTGPIDVVCHSRGGLVVGWWLAIARRNVRRIIFVGSPLEGTSLAAPHRIRSVLDLLSNISDAMSMATRAGALVFPLLTVVAALTKIVGSALNLAASTPLVDAGVTLVPGLAAQSRVGNNVELSRLHMAEWAPDNAIRAVIANFEPEESKAPLWQFWRRFRNVGGQIAHWGADALFAGPNDLVVDTESMTKLGALGISKDRTLDFGTRGDVHHCSYFRQRETAEFLGQQLA